MQLVRHIHGWIPGHLCQILILFLTLYHVPKDFEDFFAVFNQLPLGHQAHTLLQVAEVLKQGIFFDQSCYLSAFEVVKELIIYMAHLAQFAIHALADHMDVFDTGLNAPANAQQDLDTLRVILIARIESGRNWRL